MLFNSNEFIFVFLPLAFFFFYLARSISHKLGLNALAIASLVFYGYGEPKFLALLLASIFINYFLGCRLLQIKNKGLLIFGIFLNVFAIAWFKYSSFVVDNLNGVFDLGIDFDGVALPLAISFYTFQQIAFLVDSYQSKTEKINFLEYGLFISFFPQLIAGPIVHYKQVIHQFKNTEKIPASMVSTGLFVYTIGLFKKCVFADFFGTWADFVFTNTEGATSLQALLGSLAYMLQIYFDFSGYSDMAIGLGMMFGIMLPINFNSPYKAKSIDVFWRKWHITLSTWLRDYIYIPLGGNRKGEPRRYSNVMITMLIGGLWHGAGWTFIIWGGLHGLCISINHAWQKIGLTAYFTANKTLERIYSPSCWILTFMFVWLTWIVFRAENFQDVQNVIRLLINIETDKVLSFSNIDLAPYFKQDDLSLAVWLITQASFFHLNLCLIIFAMMITLFAPNSMQLLENFKPTAGKMVFSAITIFIVTVINLFLMAPNAFIYFRF